METYSTQMADRMVAAGLSDSHVVVALLDAGISVTDATVRRWRLGLSQPRAEDIAVIARALGCTPNDLLGFD